ncbi:MAG TPA: glycosyltransferase [Pirellulales bacterium]
MRILALTNLYPNPWQPQRGQFNRQQFRALAATEEVRVISPVSWVDEFRERWRTRHRLPGDRHAHCDGLDVFHPRYWYPPKVPRWTHGHCFRWSIEAAFERAVDEFQPDLVYACWAYPDGWAAVHLAHRRGLPVAVKVHGSDILVLLNNAKRRKATAAALSSADAVVAVSRDLAQRVVRLGVEPSRIQVVYDGINRSLFQPGCRRDARRRLGLDEQAPLVLFVGNLLPVKGIDVLLAAGERLAARRVTFTCLMIGRGPLAAPLRRDAARRGVGDRFRWLGGRPHHELPDWFRAANVFVLPSRSEGVPNVLLEAAACGTPFVASRVGGIPELTQLGPHRLVEPGNAQELADAIEEKLVSTAASESTGARWHSHEEAAQQLVSLFKNVLGRAEGQLTERRVAGAEACRCPGSDQSRHPLDSAPANGVFAKLVCQNRVERAVRGVP